MIKPRRAEPEARMRRDPRGTYTPYRQVDKAVRDTRSLTRNQDQVRGDKPVRMDQQPGGSDLNKQLQGVIKQVTLVWS